MDEEKHLILINGQDKTDSVASFQFRAGKYDIVYTTSPKVYSYQSSRVQILKLQQRIDPAGLIVVARGTPTTQVDEILDFGSFYHIIRTGKKLLSYRKADVELQRNCLTDEKSKDIFHYFKETAEAVSLVAENGLNILSKQYLQRQFYTVRQKELTEEKARLEQQLEHYAFEGKMEELTEKSLLLFRAELSATRSWKNGRQVFEMRDFRSRSAEFNQEYPVVLSTTYSIKGTLNIDHIYDYLIVDEASQVDLATGVLALACARNIVIVGDLQQLPNVLDGENTRSSEAIWSHYSLPETYHFSSHSLLSSALATWPEAPTVLLREHYRCHPKIINFCNQKFYNGKLIVMTADHNEPDVLTMYRTAPGNHARGHLNQRQIDVIREEVLPRLTGKGYQSIAAVLSRSPMTVKRSLNELETAGLIMRVRQGVGEPNRIYVLIPGKEDAALA